MNRQRLIVFRPPSSYSFKINLDSMMDDEKFTAKFDITWKSVRGSSVSSEPLSVIRHHLRASASKISSPESVTRCDATADQICAALATPHDLRKFGVQILQTHVDVWVDPEVLARARSRERSRERARQREQQLADEIRYIDAFRSQVLADPGMALAFWFMKHPDKADSNAYDNIEKLGRRIASYAPDNIWVQVALVVQDFVGELTEEEKRRSIEYLKGWFLRYNLPNYADRLPQVPDSGISSTMSIIQNPR
jgi:hypothetical protein